MSLVDGKIYISPGGSHKIKIYPHGFVKRVSNIDDKTMELIEEMSSYSFAMLPEDATPYQVFEQMGWKPEDSDGEV